MPFSADDFETIRRDLMMPFSKQSRPSENGKDEGPRYANYASNAGTRCLRALYYERYEPGTKAPWSPEMLRLFRAGRRHEEAAKRDLQAAGYLWREAERRIFISEIELAGKIDGFLVFPSGAQVLAEIKSVGPYQFGTLNKLEDLYAHRFYQAYPSQLQVYMRGTNEQQGVFILRNRDNEDMKFLLMAYDDVLWAEIESKFRWVNSAGARREPCERIGGRGLPEVCSRCLFRDHCCPDILYGGGITMLDDPGAAAKLDRLEELVPWVAEHARLNEWKKQAFRGIDGRIVGDWLIEGNYIGAAGKQHWKGKATRITGAPRDRG